MKLRVEVHPSKRRSGNFEPRYVVFACPYNCGTHVRLLEKYESNNKASECKKHLRACLGVSVDGARAAYDQRLHKPVHSKQKRDAGEVEVA